MPDITAECAVHLIHIHKDAVLNLNTEIWLF